MYRLILDGDLLDFTMATYPEHHIKVQVLFRCCTQDTCNWVRQGAGGGGVKKEKNKQTQREETYLRYGSALVMDSGENRKVQSVSAAVITKHLRNPNIAVRCQGVYTLRAIHSLN